MIIRNSKFKQVVLDSFTYKGTKYTKAYAKGKQLFGYNEDDYKYQYFTIESLEDGNVITLSIPAALTTSDMTDISYSTDNGSTWNTTTIDGTAKTINVNLDKGDKVLWKGNGVRMANTSNVYSNFSSTKQYNVYGNIMSLLYGDNFSSQTTLNATNTFRNLFIGSTTLVDASNLILAATNLANSCYYGMFQECTSLTKAPDLPATTLADSCYENMFWGCTSLTKAPELPATTLAKSCYKYMFGGCTSLSYIKCLATDISATDCTTNWVQNVASTGTFVKADGMTGWTIDSVNGIPTGWTVKDYIEDYASEYFTIESLEDGNVIKLSIPAALTTSDMTDISYSTDNGSTWTTTTIYGTDKTINVNLDKGDKVLWKGNGVKLNPCKFTEGNSKKWICYGNIMSLLYGDNFYNQKTLSSTNTFNGLFYTATTTDYYLTDASNLVLPATTLTESCYLSMFYNNKELLYAPKTLPALTVPRYAYQNMFRQCVKLIKAPEIMATTLYRLCFGHMYYQCYALKEVPEFHVTSLGERCYSNMFNGCTSLTKAPDLPATTLATQCYERMFEGCTSLTKAPELPATTLKNECYRNMFYNCTSLSYIKCLATDISATDCTTNWVQNVAATGTFVKADGMTGWTIDSANGIPTGWTVWDDADYYSQYFTIESLEDGNAIQFASQDAVGTDCWQSLSWSTDGTNWTTLTNVDNQGIDTTITILDSGQKLYIKGIANAYGTGNSYGNVWRYSHIGMSKECNVYGNIMSLLYGDNFSSQTTLNATYAFFSLLSGNPIVNASNLVLPATEMTFCCYKYMFSGCSKLTRTPTLPATTLDEQCYEGMFSECKSLETAPALPATTMRFQAYAFMFKGCKSLTNAPALPAMTLANYCYWAMFAECTSLVTAPALPATNIASQCYQGMFQGCTSLSAPPTLPATSVWFASYYHMFDGCTKIESIDLPATSIDSYGYDSLLANCSSLKTIRVYAPSFGYEISFGSGLPATGTYYVPRNATGYVIDACPSGWTISKTL